VAAARLQLVLKLSTVSKYGAPMTTAQGQKKFNAASACKVTTMRRYRNVFIIVIMQCPDLRV